MVYFIVILLLLSLIYIYDIKKLDTGFYVAYCFILILLISIAGLRFRIGGDTIVYMEEYKDYLPIYKVNFEYLFAFQGRQPGWVFLMSFLKSFTNSFYIVQIVHALFVNIVILSFLRKNTAYFFSSVLAYFVILYSNLNFEVLRESIAICIFILSIPFYRSKSWFSYYFLVLIAFAFHESSLFTIFLPFLRNLKIDKVLLILMLLFIPTIFLVASSFQEQLSLLALLNEDLAGKATYYFNTNESESVFAGSMIFNLLISVLLPLLMLYFYTKSKKTLYYDNLAIVAIAVYTTSLAIPIFYRFNNYLYIFIILVFIRIFMSISQYFTDRSIKNMSYLFMITLFLLVKSRIYFQEIEINTPTYVKYYPYSSIFNEKYDPKREMRSRN